MRETDFIDRNREKWERYEASLERDEQDPELLTQLYVHTTDDLSISRTFYPNRSVRVYLNGLAQRTFLHVYRGRRGELGKFFSFWTDELPRTIYAGRRYLLLALMLFVLAMLIGILSYRIDSAFAEEILGEGYVRMTETNIAGGDPMAVYKSMDEWDMSLHITLNNIFVAFLTFLAGAFFCVGSVVMLVRTGVMVGVFQYFFYARGDYVADQLSPAAEWVLRGLSWLLTAGGGGVEYVLAGVVHIASGTGTFRESLLTIWIHGALEISSIVIAGGAGLLMGSGLLFPGTYTRLHSFGRTARAGLKIMLGTVPLFVIAGFLEGYITRHTELPDWLRLAFILACFAFILWYYVVYPRAVMRRGPAMEAARRPAKTATAGRLPMYVLRGFGGRLAATFTVLRAGLGTLLGGGALLAVGFCLLSIGLADRPTALRYQFVAYFLGELENFYELLASRGRERALTYSMLTTLLLYASLRLGLDIVYRHTDWRAPREGGYGREAQLLGIAALMALSIAFGPVVSALMVFLTFPFLLVWAVGTHARGLSPQESFRLAYTRLGYSYGPCAVLLLLLVPLIFLLDTVVGSFLFQFLDWVLRTEPGTIDTFNVALQALVFTFYLVLLLVSFTVVTALGLASLLEAETASQLEERISRIGSKHRLRGLERE